MIEKRKTFDETRVGYIGWISRSKDYTYMDTYEII